MEINKKELKKIGYSFNSMASRMMRANFEEYNSILKKFINFIDNNDIIKNYIESCKNEDYDAKKDFDEVSNGHGQLLFDFGPSIEDETFQIYSVLKYIDQERILVYRKMGFVYYGSTYQDTVKEFNDRVVLVLIHNIEEYLTRVGIDMGLDEETKFVVNGGQVNIANDNANINVTQNNGVNTSELDTIIKGIIENLSEISKDDKETIIDSVEMIKDELTKPEPKVSRLRNCVTLIAPMLTIANGIPALADRLQKLIDYVAPYIH